MKCKFCGKEYSDFAIPIVHYYHIFGLCIGKKGKYGCICGCSIGDIFGEMAERSLEHSNGRYAYPISLDGIPEKVKNLIEVSKAGS